MTFKDIVISTAYKTKDGQEKKKYTNIGTLFVYDDGGLGIKLDVVPVGWDGKASVYERKPREQQGQQQSYSQPQTPPVIEIDNGSIPFN